TGRLLVLDHVNNYKINKVDVSSAAVDIYCNFCGTADWSNVHSTGDNWNTSTGIGPLQLGPIKWVFANTNGLAAQIAYTGATVGGSGSSTTINTSAAGYGITEFGTTVSCANSTNCTLPTGSSAPTVSSYV